MLNNTPFFPQLDERDCGATCLRMIAVRYGTERSMDQLRQLTRTDDSGANLAGIQEGAEALGLTTLAAELPFTELLRGDLLPAIIHWDKDHFVVVEEVDSSGASVIDPAVGPRRLTRDEFESHRYGPGRSRAGLIIRPSDRAVQSSDIGQSGGADEAGAVGAEDAELPAPPPPRKARRASGIAVALVSLLLAAALMVAFSMLRDVLAQAIDLQYREGWLRHLGSLLLATSGVSMAWYLLRTICIRYASSCGIRDNKLIGEYVVRRASDLTTEANADGYLTLLEDVDQLRAWRADNMPSLLSGLGVTLAALLWLLIVDWPIGIGLLAILLLAAGAIGWMVRRTRRTTQLAREALAAQREALYELGRILPDVASFDTGEFLQERLHLRNRAAEHSYREVSAEYGAERQILQVLLGFGFCGLMSLGFYRLGYAGLQLGDLTFCCLMSFAAVLPVLPGGLALAKYRQLLPGRMRLEEARGYSGRTHAPVLPPDDLPTELNLDWLSPLEAKQYLRLPAKGRIALVGSDEVVRGELVRALLGYSNRIGARLTVPGAEETAVSLEDLGCVGYVSRGGLVASATVAQNIALDAKPDVDRLREAQRIAGLEGQGLQENLRNLAGFGGSALTEEQQIRTLIARAIYADVDVLVLDQVLGLFKPYEEGVLLDALIGWAKDRLLIVSANRPEAAYGFQLIAHIEGGELESVGSHSELLALRSGYYYNFVRTLEEPK